MYEIDSDNFYEKYSRNEIDDAFGGVRSALMLIVHQMRGVGSNAADRASLVLWPAITIAPGIRDYRSNSGMVSAHASRSGSESDRIDFANGFFVWREADTCICMPAKNINLTD